MVKEAALSKRGLAYEGCSLKPLCNAVTKEASVAPACRHWSSRTASTESRRPSSSVIVASLSVYSTRSISRPSRSYSACSSVMAAELAGRAAARCARFGADTLERGVERRDDVVEEALVERLGERVARGAGLSNLLADDAHVASRRDGARVERAQQRDLVAAEQLSRSAQRVERLAPRLNLERAGRPSGRVANACAPRWRAPRPSAFGLLVLLRIMEVDIAQRHDGRHHTPDLADRAGRVAPRCVRVDRSERVMCGPPLVPVVDALHLEALACAQVAVVRRLVQAELLTQHLSLGVVARVAREDGKLVKGVVGALIRLGRDDARLLEQEARD
eukprot:scaffold120594_cov22-Tisochrysis_lutea.AAC.3